MLVPFFLLNLVLFNVNQLSIVKAFMAYWSKNESMSTMANQDLYQHASITELDIMLTPMQFRGIEPHTYKVKLGFTGVYIIIPYFYRKKHYGYFLEPSHRGCLKEYQQSMF